MQSVINLMGGAVLALRDPRELLRSLWMALGVPALSVLLFIAVWAALAPRIQTSLGAVPGPVAVAAQARTLWLDHLAERSKRSEFHARQEARNK